jgi:hypothetical protein
MVNGDPFGAAVESMSKEEVGSSAELGAQGNLARQGETCESRGEPKRCQASLALPGGARMPIPPQWIGIPSHSEWTRWQVNSRFPPANLHETPPMTFFRVLPTPMIDWPLLKPTSPQIDVTK